MPIQEIKTQKPETDLARSLSKYLSPEHINSLLDFVGKASGKNKSQAFAALPNAAKALHDVIPDPKRTAHLLRWAAEVSKEDVGDAFEELSDPQAARALQETVTSQGFSL